MFFLFIIIIPREVFSQSNKSHLHPNTSMWDKHLYATSRFSNKSDVWEPPSMKIKTFIEVRMTQSILPTTVQNLKQLNNYIELGFIIIIFIQNIAVEFILSFFLSKNSECIINAIEQTHPNWGKKNFFSKFVWLKKQLKRGNQRLNSLWLYST